MAHVPKITSPCPLRWNAMPSAGLDFCGQCQRRVHNLDGMDATQRQAFFANCSGDVCVAYTVTRPQRVADVLRAGAAAMALGMSGLALAADAPSSADAAGAPAFEDVVTGPNCDPSGKLEHIVVGGVRSPSVDWIDESELARPEAPEIGEVDASEWLPTPTRATLR